MDLGPPGREAGGSLLASLLQALEDNRGGAIIAFACVRAMDVGAMAIERSLPALVRAGGARAGKRALAAWREARAQSFGLLDAAYEAADAAAKDCDRRLRLLEALLAAQDKHFAARADAEATAYRKKTPSGGGGGGSSSNSGNYGSKGTASVPSSGGSKRSRAPPVPPALPAGSARVGVGGAASAAGTPAAVVAAAWRGYADDSHRRIAEALAGLNRRRVANGLDELNEAGAGGGAGGACETLEPMYCICRQVAFGDMIACDNPDCRIEWFHVQCVNVSRATLPNTWLCAECTRAEAATTPPPAVSPPAAAAAASSPSSKRRRS